jgi:hypothetical protein
MAFLNPNRLGAAVPLHGRPHVSRFLPTRGWYSTICICHGDNAITATSMGSGYVLSSAFARYITKGIRDGFRIGFNRQFPLKSAPQNKRSALEHPQIIQDYLDKECSLGCMLDPFSVTEMGRLPPCHIN